MEDAYVVSLSGSETSLAGIGAYHIACGIDICRVPSLASPLSRCGRSRKYPVPFALWMPAKGQLSTHHNGGLDHGLANHIRLLVCLTLSMARYLCFLADVSKRPSLQYTPSPLRGEYPENEQLRES